MESKTDGQVPGGNRHTRIVVSDHRTCSNRTVDLGRRTPDKQESDALDSAGSFAPKSVCIHKNYDMKGPSKIHVQ